MLSLQLLLPSQFVLLSILPFLMTVIELSTNNHKGKLIPAWLSLMTRALSKEKVKHKLVVDKEEWFL